MSRVPILCDYCKLDRCKKCDYECMNDMSTSWQKFVRCKCFIEDDEKPLTNAEMISSLLKVDVDKALKIIIEQIEFERIDIDSECAYRDPTGTLRREYECANEMLDNCIYQVRKCFEEESVGIL